MIQRNFKINSIIFFASVLILSSCSSSEQTEENSKSEASTPAKEFDPEKQEAGKKVFNDLYLKLMEFKDKNDFHEFGFGAGGKYNSWQKSVQIESVNEDYNNLLKANFGDLQMLANEFLENKGEENDYTKFIQEEFKRLKVID